MEINRNSRVGVVRGWWGGGRREDGEECGVSVEEGWKPAQGAIPSGEVVRELSHVSWNWTIK